MLVLICMRAANTLEEPARHAKERQRGAAMSFNHRFEALRPLQCSKLIVSWARTPRQGQRRSSVIPPY